MEGFVRLGKGVFDCYGGNENKVVLCIDIYFMFFNIVNYGFYDLAYFT